MSPIFLLSVKFINAMRIKLHLDHLREALRHNVKELIFSIDTEPFEQAGFSEYGLSFKM